MKFLIVDANILFSFFKKDSSVRELIRTLSNRGIRLVSPEFVLEELSKEGNKERIKEISGLNELGFAFMLSLLEKKIDLYPKSEHEGFLHEAASLLPQHPKDAPYLALALKLNCPVWSNEKRLKSQKRVSVFDTKELREELSKHGRSFG